VERKNGSDVSNKTGKWNHLKIIQSNVPRKHDIKELQKTAILGTAHTVVVLMLLYKTFSMGSSITYSINC